LVFSITDKSKGVRQEIEAFEDQFIKSQTGLDVQSTLN